MRFPIDRPGTRIIFRKISQWKDLAIKIQFRDNLRPSCNGGQGAIEQKASVLIEDKTVSECIISLQPADIGWLTGNGKKLR